MGEIELECFRTKKELQNYLISQGLDASDKAIENLKKQYKNIDLNANNNNLSMQQLDEVAGGLEAFVFDAKNGENINHENTRHKNGCMPVVCEFNDCKIVLMPNGNAEFNVYCVRVDDLENGRINFNQFRNEEHLCPMGSDEYYTALAVSKMALGDFYSDRMNVYGNKLGEKLTAEGQFIMDLPLENVANSDTDIPLTPVIDYDQPNGVPQEPDSCTLL